MSVDLRVLSLLTGPLLSLEVWDEPLYQKNIVFHTFGQPHLGSENWEHKGFYWLVMWAPWLPGFFCFSSIVFNVGTFLPSVRVGNTCVVVGEPRCCKNSKSIQKCRQAHCCFDSGQKPKEAKQVSQGWVTSWTFSPVWAGTIKKTRLRVNRYMKISQTTTFWKISDISLPDRVQNSWSMALMKSEGKIYLHSSSKLS